jgi:hypothetical protein
MRAWLRSLVNTVLGKVPGKTSRPDSATRWLWTPISATAATRLARPDQRSFGRRSASAL